MPALVYVVLKPSSKEAALSRPVGAVQSHRPGLRGISNKALQSTQDDKEGDGGHWFAMKSKEMQCTQREKRCSD